MTTRSAPAGDVDYERTGAGYGQQRRPDPRIAAQIHAALGAARTVLNVGAGGGSYEPVDRYVLAVEPSAAMRSRRPVDAAPAIDASAEALPFDDDAVDAAMAIFTVHQWPDPARGLAELRRVARGPVVVMTIDGDELGRWWLSEYWPRRHEVERARFPAIDEMRRLLGGTSRVEPIAVPLDCTDGFVEAFYGRPEALLDPAVRAAQSAWQFLIDSEIETGVARLRADLASGAWDARHGALRTAPTFTATLRLLIAEP